MKKKRYFLGKRKIFFRKEHKYLLTSDRVDRSIQRTLLIHIRLSLFLIQNLEIKHGSSRREADYPE